MVAWCHLDDIELIRNNKSTTLSFPKKLGIQVCPFQARWRLAHEQLLAMNEWIDKQFPIKKDGTYEK